MELPTARPGSDSSQDPIALGLDPAGSEYATTMTSTPSHFVPLKRELDRMTRSTLSLTELEDICARQGLDLYLEDHLFVWLMQELHDRKMRLEDCLEPEEQTEHKSSLVQDDLKHDIEDIVSLQEPEEDRLLNDQETHQLLIAVHEGLAAQEQLAEGAGETDPLELELLIRRKSEAETTLLTRNRGLVRRVCQQYQSLLNSMTMPDLEQEGNLGFLKAIHKFDLERTTKLSTYAVYWIRQAVQLAIANQDRTIRLPVHKRNEIRRYRGLEEELAEALGREPTVREIAIQLLAEDPDAPDFESLNGEDGGVAGRMEREALFRMEEHVKQLRSYILQYPTSLDQFMEGEDVDRHEWLMDENVLSPERLILREDLIEDVDEWVGQLTEPEQSVMKLRFGFGNRRPLKYVEIAQELNESQAMRALNANQEFSSYKVRSLESQARRTLARWKDADHFG